MSYLKEIIGHIFNLLIIGKSDMRIFSIYLCVCVCVCARACVCLCVRERESAYSHNYLLDDIDLGRTNLSKFIYNYFIFI